MLNCSRSIRLKKVILYTFALDNLSSSLFSLITVQSQRSTTTNKNLHIVSFEYLLLDKNDLL
jgi:hypothetical protein